MKIENIDDLQKTLHIGFGDINKYDFYLHKKLLITSDSLFIGDDDSEWEAKCFWHDGELIFVAENNWIIKDSVSVVQIVSPSLKTPTGIGVYSSFSKAESELNFDTLKDFPDGYIMFKDIKNPKLVYVFETIEGIDAMDLNADIIPDKSKITTILFNK